MGLVFRDYRSQDSIIQKEKSKELTTRNLNFLQSLGFKVASTDLRGRKGKENACNRFKS